MVTSNEEMMSMPCEELLDIINDDALNTRNEAPIWEFCLKWIAFDEENRLQNLPSILRSIRLGLLDRSVKFSIFCHDSKILSNECLFFSFVVF